MSTADPRETAVIEELTDRQAECLRLTSDGMSSKEIGRLLGISPSTVDNHIHAAVAKLHAKNRWHAAQLLHPDRITSHEDELGKRKLLPPLGGRVNKLPAKRRLLQIMSISIIAVIAMTAAISSIIAALDVFSRV